MAYHFETVKLEKGMYGRSGCTFSQTLEELDPSEPYRGTSLEGLDAFQRQLKRFDIKVKGAGSDQRAVSGVCSPGGAPGGGGGERPAPYHGHSDPV